MEKLIIRDLTIMAGKPIINGTRITVEIILKKMSEGASFSDLIQMYPSINENHLLAVLEYASQLVSHDELIEI